MIQTFVFLFFIWTAWCEEIVIQSDYWEGTQCLENGTPWQVPDSIYEESEHCSQNDTVLELGAGGSTLFFAKRCKHVTTIETNPSWAASVTERITALNIKNVTLYCIPNQKDIEKFIQEFDSSEISIVSVDTVYGYNRSAFLNRFLDNGLPAQLRMVVLDNYGDYGLFPDHYNKKAIDSNDWEIFTYDDPRWCGKGTRLYIKKG
jgi:hypothetical protein